MKAVPSSLSPDQSNAQKVWLFIDSLTFGGIETHVFELAKGLKLMKIEVTVVFIHHYGEPAMLAEKLEIAAIPFFYLNQEYPANNSYLSLAKAITTNEPTLIHAHGYKASIISKLARKLAKPAFKQVSTFHAGETPKGKVWIYDLVDRYSSALSDARLSVSKLIQQKLPSESHRLNNFIDIQSVTPSSGTQIAFVGRLSHEKAPDRFCKLAELNSHLDFHCYGSGPMENELIASSATNLTFHGHQSNMESLWDNIGFLIIPSRYEGLPMAALEAMSRGIPLLCTDVGDLHKLIVHGKNGFIVSDENSLNHQLNLWQSMSQNEKDNIRAAARETISQEYSTQSVLPQLLNIYQN
ncbi:glycosyltransferase family 4 protein [uncultured Vibrio sp.]|uniref:glycosyltransferase family 4 protein n=1 Tax=uncultured Vibrio sp. TaxID=114054 RepID=UPI0009204E42|nr:glycosyltransferase family 4 protein [uncultured Vibrio sp.]OIQ26294.1 MAG: glycosyl transferase [Vibrio sp. MedPE-SWchi]